MHLNIKGVLYDISNPQIMGILNFTPDSFNAASRVDKGEIKSRIEKMLDDGADIIDIGAMSTRPGGAFVDKHEEWNRFLPVLEIIVRDFSDTIFSIDTFRAEVAKRAVCDYGVSIINDISAGNFDDDMFKVVADAHAPYIIMHENGDFRQMHEASVPSLQDVMKSLSEKIVQLHSLGVSDIIVDPGFGFSKSLDLNYEMMEKLESFKILGCPILVGVSRKSMIYKYLDIDVEHALNGTSVLNTIAVMKGASILRVHDVKEAVEVVKLVKKVFR